MTTITSISEALSSIVLPVPMPTVPDGFVGVVVSAIRTPCRAPCLRDTVYVGFHLIPTQMKEAVQAGCDDRDLIALLEQATPHQPIGCCPVCGAPGRESSSAELLHLSSRIDVGPAEDESYEHLAVWAIRSGETLWTTIYLHWSLAADPSPDDLLANCERRERQWREIDRAFDRWLTRPHTDEDE